MTTEHKPDDFDWVSVRESCAPARIVQDLRPIAARDVDLRNAALGQERFVCEDHGQGFKILDRSALDPWEVAVTVTPISLRVNVMRRGDRYSLSATLSEAGDRVFDVAAEEGEAPVLHLEALWQVSRWALEGLFYVHRS